MAMMGPGRMMQAPIGGLLPGYQANNYVDFDGSADYLDGLATTGLTDNKLFTFSLWVKAPAAAGNQVVFDLDGGAVRIRTTATRQIWVTGENTGGTVILDIVSVTTLSAGVSTHVAGAFDLADTGKRDIRFDGVASSLTVNTYTNQNLDWSRTESAVGASTSGVSKFDGGLQEFWAANQYLALSGDPFRSGGKPADLGADGSTPTGTQPPFYLNNPFGSFETNKGSLGNFTVNGTLADEGTSPSD